MTGAEYLRCRPGDRVRARQPLSNRLAEIPAGTEGVIEYKHHGPYVKFDACSTCGISVRMTKIDPAALDLL